MSRACGTPRLPGFRNIDFPVAFLDWIFYCSAPLVTTVPRKASMIEDEIFSLPPIAMIQSKQWQWQWQQWQQCKSIKHFLPARTQRVHNQIRWLSHTAVQLKAKEYGEQSSRLNTRLKTRSWSLFSDASSSSVRWPSQSHDFSRLTVAKIADDLLYLEKFFSHRRIVLRSTQIPLVVLLLTPSRLELLNDENTFIPRLLDLLFSNPEAARWFDVLVTVVDKIPYPRASPWGMGYANQLQGGEGISMLMGESEEIAPDLGRARDWVEERETTTIQPPGVLSFRFKPSATLSHTTENEPTVVSFDLKVPVANTIFHNGQTSTLYAERWISSDSAPGFSCVRKVSLPQQTLHVGGLFPEPCSPQFNLISNLQPIGSPRIVAAAVGNIIRQMYAGSGSDPETAVPASKELEEAISQHLETKKDPTQKLDVWALVTPRGSSLTTPPGRGIITPSNMILNLIWRGSRLHRVMSGGGGWGIKKGLLALDPDSDYNCPEHEMQMGVLEDPIKDLAGAQIYRDVVKPGDIVSFFTPTLFNPPGDPRKFRGKLEQSAVFGALPSSMDAIPDSTSASGQTRLPFVQSIIKNHFGILSEHGTSVNIHHRCFDDSGNFGAENPGVVVRTKLDAPSMLFSAEAEESWPFPAEKKLYLGKSIGESIGESIVKRLFEPPADTKEERVGGPVGLMSNLAQSLASSQPPELKRSRRQRDLMTWPSSLQPVNDEMIPEHPVKHSLIRTVPIAYSPWVLWNTRLPVRKPSMVRKRYSLSTGQWTLEPMGP